MKNLIALLTIVLVAALALAQAGPPAPADQAQHRVKFLTTLLSLNSAQQQQALTIFTSEASAESALHDSMKSAHVTLNTAVTNNDQPGIDQAASTIGQLMGQSVALHAKAEASFLQTLNPEQQSKMSQFEAESRHPGPFLGMPGNAMYVTGGPVVH